MGITRIVACHRRISLRLTMPATFTKSLAWRLAWLAGLLLFGTLVGRADTHYVWRDNPAPVSPYTNGWASASTQIQAAVDAAVDGDTVLVTNGTYDTGGKVTPSYALTNRVCITKSITVRSFNNDPANTIIKGAPDAGTGGCGPAAVRCVRMQGGASLSGFTLTDGHTLTNGNTTLERSGGSVLLHYGGTVSNCVISGNKASYNAGGAEFVGAALVSGGTMSNCTLTANFADLCGGGANFHVGGTMNNCTLNCNTSNAGGGLHFYGGGAMNNCTLSNNVSLANGGGVYNTYTDKGQMSNCLLVANQASGNGGGVWLRYNDEASALTLNNCLLIGNIAVNGGNVYFSGDGTLCGTLNNCTLAAGSSGVYMDNGGAMTNCIVWGNTNYDISIATTGKVSYTCSGGTKPPGEGNITNNPQLVNTNAGNYRLASSSPCVNTGTNQAWMTNAVDLDGRIRIRYGMVDMGAYELVYKGSVFSFQ